MCLQLIERHLVLMACELIMFVILLMYTSSRQPAMMPSSPSTAGVVSSSSHVARSAVAPAGVEELTVVNRCESAVNTVPLSPRRQRSVERLPRTAWTAIRQQMPIKSGKCGCSFTVSHLPVSLLRLVHTHIHSFNGPFRDYLSEPVPEW